MLNFENFYQEPESVAGMAADGNFVPFLQVLRNVSSGKLSAASGKELCNILECCVNVCCPLVAAAASSSDADCRAQLVEMISTLSSSAKLPTSKAPVDFFSDVLLSSEESVAAAALRHLPAFVLRCPAASNRDWVALLRRRLEADDTSIGIKALIPRTLAHLVCAICAVQLCGSDTERAVKCEVLPSMGSCDPVEHFVAKQGLYSESHGAGAGAQKGAGERPARVAHEAPMGVWCCGDRCAARYGSAAHNQTLALPFGRISQKSAL